jgi:uncharacterized protein with PQ loop repeat
LILLYIPVSIVFLLIIAAMIIVFPQLKGSTGSKDVARVKAKVLRVSSFYLASFLIYYLLLGTCYLTGLNVHSCPNYSPPACIAWAGWDCNDLKQNEYYFAAQKAFMFLFCARGILDFVLFFFFSYRMIVKRMKDKEYDDQETSNRHKKLELHDAYRKEIMNLIQIGISRSAIKTHHTLELKDSTSELIDVDFTTTEDVDVLSKDKPVVHEVVLHSLSESSEVPAAHPPKDIRFQALAPKVFESIRRSASISATEYAEAMNPSSTSSAEAFNIEESQANVLIEKLSEGRGGAFFYFSQNFKFVIKTISDGEYNFMSSILKKMWKQMVRDDTLLSRYFGVYTLLYRGADIKIVVMENVSYMFPRLPIHRKYDLKGSWVSRSMMKSNEALKLPTETDKRTLKDMDMCYSVALSSKTRKDLIQAIQKDIDFLADAGIMDYSLFLSFHIKRSCDSLSSELLDMGEAPSAAVDNHAGVRVSRGMFREHKGGVAVQLNYCEPTEFLRRPDGRPVQVHVKRGSRSSRPSRPSASREPNGFPMVSLEESMDYGVLAKLDPPGAGNPRSKNFVQIQVISIYRRLSLT